MMTLSGPHTVPGGKQRPAKVVVALGEPGPPAVCWPSTSTSGTKLLRASNRPAHGCTGQPSIRSGRPVFETSVPSCIAAASLRLNARISRLLPSLAMRYRHNFVVASITYLQSGRPDQAEMRPDIWRANSWLARSNDGSGHKATDYRLVTTGRRRRRLLPALIGRLAFLGLVSCKQHLTVWLQICANPGYPSSSTASVTDVKTEPRNKRRRDRWGTRMRSSG